MLGEGDFCEIGFENTKEVNNVTFYGGYWLISHVEHLEVDVLVGTFLVDQNLAFEIAILYDFRIKGPADNVSKVFRVITDRDSLPFHDLKVDILNR